MSWSDTIAAISTPAGRGGIGIVRVSGPEARQITARWLRPEPPWTPWQASLASLMDADGSILDQIVVTYFQAPRSFTAEDVVELSCHGSPAVLRRCVELVCASGARPARPGEFTLRAYMNGRIDLPRAEAIRDLIESTTIYQARVAAQQAGGSVSRRVAPIKEQLLELIALLEAGIDFAEDDIGIAADAELLRRLTPVAEAVRGLRQTFDYGRLVRSGITLAIAGKPNAGKSSLFNRLIQRDRAIVTDTPGTTRDTVEEEGEIQGIPIRFVDTAGIRDTDGHIERLGIERSYRAMADADLTLVVLDLTSEPDGQEDSILDRAKSGGRYLAVGNKADLPHRRDAGLKVSSVTGEGLEALRQAILDAVAPGTHLEPESGFITSLRHEQRLGETMDALTRASAAVRDQVPHEMLLLDLYSALAALDEITGATTADDILNRIFSSFCIGK